MNGKERFNAVTHFRPFDRVFNREFGWWKEVFPEWHNQGLPKEVNENDKGDVFFKFDKFEELDINCSLAPGFEHKIIEEDKDYKIVIDWKGVTQKIFQSGASSIPHYLDYSLKDRESWKEFKKKLVPGMQRYPKDWKECVKKWNVPGRDYPVGINAGSIIGTPRDWMGFENTALMFYDDPILMEEIITTMADVVVGTIEPALKEVKFDFAYMWEDIAFKNGPMISPEMFEKFCVPQYKRITSLLRKYGVDVVWLDCDGDINPIVHLFLKAGVNGMFPLEVACKTDPVELRKKYGKDVLLFGGVNKRELSKDKKAIDAEIEKLRPIVEGGGFIPHVDHRCPPDVSYDNYLYYLKKKKEVFNIKDWDLEPIIKTLRK
ncbi:MAG: uroporphyrinogen decarboxylase family protein [Candidatus Firestonebacteria bacterium]